MAQIEVPTEQKGKYRIYFRQNNEFDICYEDFLLTTNNYWKIKNPLIKRLPVFMLQLSIIISLTRVLMLIFTPLRQPRFLYEIMGGILLGPCGLAALTDQISTLINPFEGALFMETMANVGVTFYMFLVGLEMDLTPIRRIGKTALSVAVAGIVLPICTGAGLHLMVSKGREDGITTPLIGAFFWAIALSITSFPDLARLLSDLKLMNTDLGKTALAAAVISDVTSWILLVATVSLVNGHPALYRAIPVLLCMTAFWFIIRPIISWLVKQTAVRRVSSSSEGKYGDGHVYFILSAALLFGYLTEVCGAHSMFGAFAFGLMIPRGELGTMVMEKIEEFVVGILLPPIFLITGLRTNFKFVFETFSVGMVLLVVLLACSAKIVSTFLVCMYFNCSKRDSFVLGVLMNTKGVIVVIVLNEGRSMKGFDQRTFSFMVLALLVMTIMIGPIVSCMHKSSRHLKAYHHSTFERCRPDIPLRVLACIHAAKNLSGLINLLRISNATRRSPITVFAVHLVELAGRATAMLIFHDKNNKLDDNIGNNAASRERTVAEQIMRAFESFEKENHAVSIQPLTVVSPYDTMHEDVRNFASDKLANIILIPFHKQPNSLGGWVDENLEHKQVNENLLAAASCTVGLLVDRGLTSPFNSESKRSGSSRQEHSCRIAMLFVEGRDDREALAYARRIATTPCVQLTVVRFVPAAERNDDVFCYDQTNESEMFSNMLEREKERQIDDDYINELRFRTMHDQSISYMERQVEGGDQIVSIITSVFHNNVDLYIVGRGHGQTCSLTSGLSDWTDYPELGPLGETLVSMDSESPAASVLIVQQSAPATISSKEAKNFNDGMFGDSVHSVETFVNHRRTGDRY